jgi:hypothetical protein
MSVQEKKVSDGIRGFAVWEVTEVHEPPGGSHTHWEVRSEVGNVRARFDSQQKAEADALDPQ